MQMEKFCQPRCSPGHTAWSAPQCGASWAVLELAAQVLPKRSLCSVHRLGRISKGLKLRGHIRKSARHSSLNLCGLLRLPLWTFFSFMRTTFGRRPRLLTWTVECPRPTFFAFCYPFSFADLQSQVPKAKKGLGHEPLRYDWAGNAACCEGRLPPSNPAALTRTWFLV